MAMKLKIYCVMLKGKYWITCPTLDISITADTQFDAESQFCVKMAEVMDEEELLKTRVKFKWI